MNQLYIFPRTTGKLDTSTELSSDSDDDLAPVYNLKSQNQVSRKNQTNKPQNTKIKLGGGKKNTQTHQSLSVIDEYHSTKSVKSVHSVESVGKTLKARKSKCKARNIEITFDTKKKSPHKKKRTSQTKLLVEQYSLNNRAYESLKKSSKGLLISYRPTKNHEINLSVSSSKKVKKSAR